MKLKLENDKDKLAMLQVIRWTSEKAPRIANLLSAVGNFHIPAEEDFEVIIKKEMIPATYRSNPSLLASNILGKLIGFKSCAGAECQNTDYIKVLFYRGIKNTLKYSEKPSVKHQIRNWLETEDIFLDVEVKDISEAYKTRPEQLTYHIKRETGKQIKIKRYKTKWVITRG